MTLVKKTVTVYTEEWRVLSAYSQLHGIKLTNLIQDIIYSAVDEIRQTNEYKRRRPFVPVCISNNEAKKPEPGNQKTRHQALFDLLKEKTTDIDDDEPIYPENFFE